MSHDPLASSWLCTQCTFSWQEFYLPPTRTLICSRECFHTCLSVYIDRPCIPDNPPQEMTPAHPIPPGWPLHCPVRILLQCFLSIFMFPWPIELLKLFSMHKFSRKIFLMCNKLSAIYICRTHISFSNGIYIALQLLSL